MQRQNFMQENAAQLEDIVRNRMDKSWSVNSFAYAENCSPAPTKSNMGPGVISIIKHEESGKRFALCFPVAEYPTLPEFIDCLNVDMAFTNIMHNHPELGIATCALSKNQVSVYHPHDRKIKLELAILDQVYNKNNGSFDCVKFQELTTEALKANPISAKIYRGCDPVTNTKPAVIDISRAPATIAAPMFVDVKEFQQSPKPSN